MCDVRFLTAQNCACYEYTEFRQTGCSTTTLGSSVTTEDAEACKALCDSDEACNAVVYSDYTSYGYCYKKTACAQSNMYSSSTTTVTYTRKGK